MKRNTTRLYWKPKNNQGTQRVTADTKEEQDRRNFKKPEKKEEKNAEKMSRNTESQT